MPNSKKRAKTHKLKIKKNSKKRESRRENFNSRFFVVTLQEFFNGETAFEIVGVRAMSIWWRRGESNPCPKTHPTGFLRVKSILIYAFIESEPTKDKTKQPFCV